jgi:hypothetical protein
VRRDDHERRDAPAAVAQDRVVLERPIEVGFAVEDRDRDVAPGVDERLELVGLVDDDRLEVRLAELRGDGRGLVARERDGDGWTGLLVVAFSSRRRRGRSRGRTRRPSR